MNEEATGQRLKSSERTNATNVGVYKNTGDQVPLHHLCH